MMLSFIYAGMNTFNTSAKNLNNSGRYSLLQVAPNIMIFFKFLIERKQFFIYIRRESIIWKLNIMKIKEIKVMCILQIILNTGFI